jgi:hypothetical protein
MFGPLDDNLGMRQAEKKIKNLELWLNKSGEFASHRKQYGPMFGIILRAVNELCNVGFALQLQPLIEEEQELQLKDDIHSLLEQRAKETWLQFGDRNTKFFHASANQKFKSHRIEKILDQEGQLFTEHSEIEGAFINDFTELFTAGSDLEVEASSNAIQPKVTAAMNNQLLVDFTPDEIGIALSQMAALKAPGPDGFTSSFSRRIGAPFTGRFAMLSCLFLILVC